MKMKGRLKEFMGKWNKWIERTKKKNVVVYNLPESKRKEARKRYREDEEACRIIFEERIVVQQVEQKQLIRLGKRE